MEDGLAVAGAGWAGLGVALGQSGQGGDVAHGAGCQVGPGGVASQGDLPVGGYLVQLALRGPGDGPTHRWLDGDEAGGEGFGAGGDEVRHGGRSLWVGGLVGRSVPDGLLLDRGSPVWCCGERFPVEVALAWWYLGDRGVGVWVVTWK